MQPRDLGGLTVALPTFNGARHLAETLRSVLAQGNSFPIVLCDDRSDDDTVEVARGVAGDRLTISVNAERLGLAGNWNRCVALSGSKFVAIVHQDDVLRAGHLASHGEAIARDPRLGWVASGTGTVDDAGREVPASVVDRGGLGPSDLVFAPGDAIRALAVANPLRCSAVTINAGVHAEVGGFDPSFRYVVDWDYWLRVARNHTVAWLAATTVDVRWHAASETHRFARGTADLDETIRLLDGLYADDGARWPDAARLRRSADRRVARAFLNRAHVALRAGDAELARRTLRRSLNLEPGLLGQLALDPRLAVQMVTLAIAPHWAARLFKRP
jgi:glycosyltransferase involved in cell wall biosynthesis